MIQSLLIANRGEIACRVIRTARELGIRTVAVYSDADAGALHVRMADEAVHIGPSAAAESYLVGEKIVAAAKDTGAEAIHPGYGFLSENADFAQAVLDAGLLWVGPKPASIRAMGLKDAAKTLMDEAGVPTTPGYIGDNQEPAFLAERAAEIGYPVLIKAVAGGGGKGMRKVERAEDFADGLQSAQREAKAAFGNDVVLLEKWVESPRHIEVQIFGDSHGNVVHLFERDCSLQRRHQKVIEEAPAPGMDAETREAVCGAAVRAAQAVDYEGAGTVEFIADGSEGLRADRIYFMEMNTRLQVEHPVTEEITGVDLVEWQLRVASGEPIPMQQDELAIDGHAIEARLYAEDPSSGFLPSTGRLELFDLDPHGRIETGVETGADISPFYDPMIAKMIIHADTRDEAREGLREMIANSAVWPVKSNAAFLVNALDHPDFAAANLDTGLIGRAGDALLAGGPPEDAQLGEEADALVQSGPMAGFRLNASRKDSAWFLLDGEAKELPIGTGVAEPAEELLVASEGQVFALKPFRADGSGAAAAGDGAILAPMPGKIIAVNVSEGDVVKAGDKLVTLEAMKMEHSLTAPFDGTVSELKASMGAQVQKDAALVVVEADA